MVSAEESTSPDALLLVGDVVNLTERVPVAQRGFESFLGDGINNVPCRLPMLSDNRRLSLITARAPDVCPTNISPTRALPKKFGLTLSAIAVISIFKNGVCDAYDSANVACPTPYGSVFKPSFAAATFS